jgi:hypothetical protein
VRSFDQHCLLTRQGLVSVTGTVVFEFCFANDIPHCDFDIFYYFKFSLYDEIYSSLDTYCILSDKLTQLSIFGSHFSYLFQLILGWEGWGVIR